MESGSLCHEQGVRITVSGSGCQDQGVRITVSGSLCQDWGVRIRVSGSLCHDQGVRIRVLGSGCQGQDHGFESNPSHVLYDMWQMNTQPRLKLVDLVVMEIRCEARTQLQSL